MKTAFVACSSRKKRGRMPARDLYAGILFKKSFVYCRNRYDQVFILSAKYGLLHPDDVIEDYDITLLKMKCDQRRHWAERVKKQAQERNIDLNEVHYYTGKRYYEFLPARFHPLSDLGGIGYQLEWLTQQNNRMRGLFDE